jgi:hypothetical protein
MGKTRCKTQAGLSAVLECVHTIVLKYCSIFHILKLPKIQKISNLGLWPHVERTKYLVQAGLAMTRGTLYVPVSIPVFDEALDLTGQTSAHSGGVHSCAHIMHVPRYPGTGPIGSD